MTKSKDGTRKVWLLKPRDAQAYPGLSRAVVIAKSIKEAEALVFEDEEDRIPVRVEQIGVCPHSFHSWVVCVQMVASPL